MKKSKLLIFVILIFILVIISTAGGYWFGKTNPNAKIDETSQKKVMLEWKAVILNGVSENEGEQIETFVDEFETYKFQEDPDKLLGMFTPPKTKEEQEHLDFLLGKDHAQGSTEPLSRLFSTQSYNHSVDGHYVRSIKKNDKSIIVTVDELRIFYVSLTEDSTGYSAKVVNLVLEIEKADNKYKITHYYHANQSNQTLKYEGFLVRLK